MAFVEVGLDKISEYKNPFSLFKDAGIALADNGERVNGLTIGWGSVGILWRRPCMNVYIHESRFSKKIFDDASYFSVCFFDDEYKDAVKYFGTVSGRNEDKVLGSHLTLIKEEAPYFSEAKMVVICKKMGQSKFDNDHVEVENIKEWYSQDGVHTIYYGEIIKVLIKE